MVISEKIKNRDDLNAVIATLRAQGKKIGFTSGVFDLMHPGHVDYLEKAKRQCDVLIVAVNTDASVRLNKGDLRPICAELDRVQVIAALESVDYVFLFGEKNNNLNIEIIKPDLYLKAGDYSKEKLSSAAIVESYGGAVQLIPFTAGHSSSKIIDKISMQALQGMISSDDLDTASPVPVVFLDRDGTINEEVFYLHEPSKLKIIPGVIEGLKKLQAAGFSFVMVTNQPGIGLGYFTKEDFFVLTKKLFSFLAPEGIKFSKIYFCPHSESERCACRKPATGMLERAKREMAIDWENSFVVGDMTSDIAMAKSAGLRSVLLETGSAGSDGKCQVTATARLPGLSETADFIIQNTTLKKVQ